MSNPLLMLIAVVACVIVGAGCSSIPHRLRPPLSEGGLAYRTVEVGGVVRRYAVYVPREYRAQDDHPWPCVIFLNGSGECGTDGQRQLTQGLLPAMINTPQDWPMIAIFPQKPDRASTWLDHDELVLATLRKTSEELRIDPKRVYLTGLSQGGAGAWAIGARHADIFAAIAPICGFLSGPISEQEVGAGLASMPVWAMHGEKDDVVPIAQSEKLVAAVHTASGRVVAENPPSGSSLQPGNASSLRFTRFPDLNHGCWDRAYRDMELGEWLLSFRQRATK
jgi:predicted peptidase